MNGRGVQLITQAEYARRRGVAKSAVCKAVSEQRISLIDGKIDPTVADIQWERNTRARADSERPADVSRGASAGTASNAGAGDARQAAAGSASPSNPSEFETPSSYSVDRARREKYEADMAQLKLLEQQGDLVRVVEVRAEMAKAIGQLRQNALQLPARLAPIISAETDQAAVHAMLDAEMRTLLSTFAGGAA